MDAVKKAQLEKRAVLVLAGVFGLVFVMGPMRSLGLFKPASAALTPPAATVSVTKSVGGMLQQGWDKMGEQIDQAEAPAVEAPASLPAYTAFDRRDPFKSYLPKPAAMVAAEQAAAASEAPVEPPAPPPDLRVDGLLWGGSEPKAIINGRLYRVDDRIDGARITAIDGGGVTVEYLGQPVVYSTAAAR